MKKKSNCLIFIISFSLLCFATQKSYAFGPGFFKKIIPEIFETIGKNVNTLHKGSILVRSYLSYCNRDQNKNKSFCIDPNKHCHRNPKTYPCPNFLKEFKPQSNYKFKPQPYYKKLTNNKTPNEIKQNNIINKKTLYCLESKNTVYTIYAVSCNDLDIPISSNQYQKIINKTQKSSGGIKNPIIFLIIILGIVYFVYRIRKNNTNTNSENINMWTNDYKSNDSVEARLEKLKKLLDDNIISKEEYEEQRKKIIGDV